PPYVVSTIGGDKDGLLNVSKKIVSSTGDAVYKGTLPTQTIVPPPRQQAPPPQVQQPYAQMTPNVRAASNMAINSVTGPAAMAPTPQPYTPQPRPSSRQPVDVPPPPPTAKVPQHAYNAHASPMAGYSQPVATPQSAYGRSYSASTPSQPMAANGFGQYASQPIAQQPPMQM